MAYTVKIDKKAGTFTITGKLEESKSSKGLAMLASTGGRFVETEGKHKGKTVIASIALALSNR